MFMFIGRSQDIQIKPFLEWNYSVFTNFAEWPQAVFNIELRIKMILPFYRPTAAHNLTGVVTSKP